MQCRTLVQNCRAKGFNALALKAFPRRFPLVGRWKKRSRASVSLYVCTSVQALSPLEPKRLVGSGRANNHSMHRSGGEVMVTVLDRSVARGTCRVRSHKPLQKSCSQECRSNQWTDLAQTWWADSHHRWAQSVWVSDSGAPFTRLGVT